MLYFVYFIPFVLVVLSQPGCSEYSFLPWCTCLSEFGEEIFNTSDISKQASLKDEFVDVNLQLIKILARKKKVCMLDTCISFSQFYSNV